MQQEVSSRMNTHQLKLISLDQELRTAMSHLRRGLGELQRMDGANDFYHLPMMLLATGLERLGKVAFCLHSFKRLGCFPKSRRELPAGKTGHDVQALFRWVIENCFDSTYCKRPAAAADLRFLRDDTTLNRILRMVSDFGLGARYHHIDVVLSGASATRAPEDVWQELELQLLKRHANWAEELSHGALDEVYRLISSEVVSPLEQALRAICRLFTLGPLGPDARRFQGHLRPFLTMRDEEFGRSDYRNSA